MVSLLATNSSLFGISLLITRLLASIPCKTFPLSYWSPPKVLMLHGVGVRIRSLSRACYVLTTLVGWTYQRVFINNCSVYISKHPSSLLFPYIPLVFRSASVWRLAEQLLQLRWVSTVDGFLRPVDVCQDCWLWSHHRRDSSGHPCFCSDHDSQQWHTRRFHCAK